MSTQTNKILVGRFYEEVFNERNLDAIDALVARDTVDHGAFPGQAPGAAGVKQTCGMILAAFPDLHLTVEDQVAEGDRVVTRWTARGTHGGAFMGIASTGKPVSTTGIGIDRVAASQLAETWMQWDSLGLLQQLGALPVPASATR
jgi:steroid delta-isomerase-like uncharacterized protein